MRSRTGGGHRGTQALAVGPVSEDVERQPPSRSPPRAATRGPATRQPAGPREPDRRGIGRRQARRRVASPRLDEAGDDPIARPRPAHDQPPSAESDQPPEQVAAGADDPAPTPRTREPPGGDIGGVPGHPHEARDPARVAIAPVSAAFDAGP
jgi:hypothetical protein